MSPRNIGATFKVKFLKSGTTFRQLNFIAFRPGLATREKNLVIRRGRPEEMPNPTSPRNLKRQSVGFCNLSGNVSRFFVISKTTAIVRSMEKHLTVRYQGERFFCRDPAM